MKQKKYSKLDDAFFWSRKYDAFIKKIAESRVYVLEFAFWFSEFRV